MARKPAAWTPAFVLSFPALFAPRPQGEREIMKYSMEMLFPKPQFKKAEFADLVAIYEATKPAEWGNWQLPSFWKLFKKGEERNNNPEKPRPEFDNKYILSAAANEDFPPILLRQDETEASKSDIYAGCICRALLSCYHWTYRKVKDGPIIKRGVSLNIDMVQKIKDGDPLGGGGRMSENDREYYLKQVRKNSSDMSELDDEIPF